MRSEAQIQASRINGAKSHGPKTPGGKAISSRNSLRHGQTAEAILLRNEDPRAYCNLAESFFDKFKPLDEVERHFVDEMAIARWRMQRDWINETALLDIQMSLQVEENRKYTKIDPACTYSLAFKELADNSKALQLNARYETNHRRAFYRAFKGLLELRQVMNSVSDTFEPDPESLEPNNEQSPQPVEEPRQPIPITSANPPAAPPQNRPEPEQNKLCETNPGSPEPRPTNDEEIRDPDRQSPLPNEQMREDVRNFVEQAPE